MTKWLVSLLAVLMLAAMGCQKHAKSTTVPSGGKAPVSQLEVNITRTDVPVTWGVPVEIPVEVQWKSGQKYAVQLTPSPDTPEGIHVELIPAIVDPPGHTTLRISPVVGEAPLMDHTITIEASTYGMSEPVRKTVKVSVVREDGEFTPVLAGPVTVECRNVCGKLANGRVTFYDVLREKNQSCGDKAPLPESQKIGMRSYAVSNTGFGYGRTCRVAAVFEPSGGLSIVNIGPAAKRAKRGEVFMTISSAGQCWLSPDNTIALVKQGSELRLYDIYTGNPLGETCRSSGAIGNAILSGSRVTAGSCSWTIP